jgi:CelD/BcsL family acetyltransferase involved in cellulose biosynthesis
MHTRLFEGIGDFLSWWNSAKPAARFLAFQNPQIMDAWEKTIGAQTGAACYVLRVDDDAGVPLLAVFLSIQRQGRLGLRTLSFMDAGVIDYNAPILFEPFGRPMPAPQALWDAIRSSLPSHDFVALRKMPATVMNLRNPLFDARDQPHFCSGHAMSLPNDWAAVEREKGSHKHVKTIKRKARLLSQLGQVKMSVAETAAERNRILDVLIAQKNQRLAETGFAEMSSFPGRDAFYHRCAAVSDPPVVHLSALCVDAEPVATLYGFLDRDCFYGVLTAFAHGPWARYSCGNIHLEHLIRWAIENKLKLLNFGTGDEDYKLYWCDQNIALVDWRGPASLAGRLYLAVHKGLAAARGR